MDSLLLRDLMVVFNELERLWPSGVENVLPVPVTRQAVDRVRIRALSGRETYRRRSGCGNYPWRRSRRFVA